LGELKVGQKLKSSVCDTQVMIIKTIAGMHELTCGGAPMDLGLESQSAELDPDKAKGTLIGKRYVNADESVELLCVKGGAGTLYLDGEELLAKQAKALPSSD
jgi:hypothetical protein